MTKQVQIREGDWDTVDAAVAEICDKAGVELAGLIDKMPSSMREGDALKRVMNEIHWEINRGCVRHLFGEDTLRSHMN